MSNRRLLLLMAVIASASLSGCASDIRRMVSDLDEQRIAIELVETPFYAQVSDQCGPSALATLLQTSGVTVTPEELKSRVYLPGREGSLQIELLAATRGYQRVPYLIGPEILALLDELRSGRPVLVLQNLGRKLAPIWHYAVVVGYLPEENRLVLRSGDRKRHLVKPSSFFRTWRRAEYWGMVALLPGELPSMVDADKYIRSVAAFETVGDNESAAAGYATATTQWPLNPLAWLGLGNVSYAQNDLIAAEHAYQKLLTIDPENAAALNNLAQVQADQGCYEDASTTLNAALSAARPESAMYDILQDTRREIESRQSPATCL